MTPSDPPERHGTNEGNVTVVVDDRTYTRTSDRPHRVVQQWKNERSHVPYRVCAMLDEIVRLRAENAALRWRVKDAEENAWLIARAKLAVVPNADAEANPHE